MITVISDVIQSAVRFIKAWYCSKKDVNFN